MPRRNTRQWAKRKLEFARGNIDTCGSHLNEVVSVYEEHHPEITSNIDIVMALLVEVDSLIEKIDRGI